MSDAQLRSIAMEINEVCYSDNDWLSDFTDGLMLDMAHGARAGIHGGFCIYQQDPVLLSLMVRLKLLLWLSNNY